MTTPLTQRVALVTGASSGIGEAIALRFASMGITTYAAARRVDRMVALRQHGIHVLPLDSVSYTHLRAHET